MYGQISFSSVNQAVCACTCVPEQSKAIMCANYSGSLTKPLKESSWEGLVAAKPDEDPANSTALLSQLKPLFTASRVGAVLSLCALWLSGSLCVWLHT